MTLPPPPHFRIYSPIWPTLCILPRIRLFICRSELRILSAESVQGENMMQLQVVQNQPSPGDSLSTQGRISSKQNGSLSGDTGRTGLSGQDRADLSSGGERPSGHFSSVLKNQMRVDEAVSDEYSEAGYLMMPLLMDAELQNGDMLPLAFSFAGMANSEMPITNWFAENEAALQASLSENPDLLAQLQSALKLPADTSVESTLTELQTVLENSEDLSLLFPLMQPLAASVSEVQTSGDVVAASGSQLGLAQSAQGKPEERWAQTRTTETLSSSGLLPEDAVDGESSDESFAQLWKTTELQSGKSQTTDKLQAWSMANLEADGPVAETLIPEELSGLEFDVSDSKRPSTLNLNRQTNPVLQNYSTTVGIPVADPEWGGEVSEKIVWMAQKHIQFAEIHLNPAELGPMEVKISVQNDQATISFSSQHAGVRELLELNVNRLRDMLDENGVALSQFDVGDQQSGQHGAEQASDEALLASSKAGHDDELSDESLEHGVVNISSSSSAIDFYA